MSFVDAALEIEFRGALVSVAIVVALYVFVGNSGVISFGHVSFVAVGAFTAGVMTIPVELKPTITPGLFSLLGEHSVGNVASLRFRGRRSAACSHLLVGIPLMRLSGLAAGIATFAVLGVTYNILNNWTKIGPGPLTLTTVPETTDLLQATLGAIAVVTAAFAYQRSRIGRKLRAAREDSAAARAAGIDIHRERLWAFALSGALVGVRRRPSRAPGRNAAGTRRLSRSHVPHARDARCRRRRKPVGGRRRCTRVSALDTFLLRAESGEIGFVDDLIGKPLWGGSRLVGVAIFMAVVLVLLPQGLTRGREFRLPDSAPSCPADPGVRRDRPRLRRRRRDDRQPLRRASGAGRRGVGAHAQTGARDALNELGLRVTGRASIEAQVQATSDPRELRDFDLGIIACKGTDLDTAARALEGRAPRQP